MWVSLSRHSHLSDALLYVQEEDSKGQERHLNKAKEDQSLACSSNPLARLLQASDKIDHNESSTIPSSQCDQQNKSEEDALQYEEEDQGLQHGDAITRDSCEVSIRGDGVEEYDARAAKESIVHDQTDGGSKIVGPRSDNQGQSACRLMSAASNIRFSEDDRTTECLTRSEGKQAQYEDPWFLQHSTAESDRTSHEVQVAHAHPDRICSFGANHALKCQNETCKQAEDCKDDCAPLSRPDVCTLEGSEMHSINLSRIDAIDTTTTGREDCSTATECDKTACDADLTLRFSSERKDGKSNKHTRSELSSD